MKVEWARRELAGPECPSELTYLWLWFLELNSARTFNSTMPNPISFSEIAAWRDLMRAPVTSWDVGMLRTLDAIWLTVPKDGIPDDA